MRIVITGAAGFVGRALIRQLAGNHAVVALDSHAVSADGVEPVVGDIGDPAVLARAFAGGCDAVVHLATVPGGAAEQDPAEAWRVNVDASVGLIEAAGRTGGRPRFVLASSIAVFGDPLPPHIDDDTPLLPKMLYGAHKAIIETWLATQTRRGAVTGLALRLPGIVARPGQAAGLKSVFMSDVFHAMRRGEPITLPVSPDATMWLMSLDRIAANFNHALAVDVTGSVTLPALRVTMRDLVATLGRATGSPVNLVAYAPDAALEAAFGRQPPLTTALGDDTGFRHDGDIDALVASALTTLS